MYNQNLFDFNENLHLNKDFLYYNWYYYGKYNKFQYFKYIIYKNKTLFNEIYQKINYNLEYNKKNKYTLLFIDDRFDNIFQYIPRESQVGLFSATFPDELMELTNKFMNNPKKILVKKEELTLEGIKQFYINVKHNNWKYDVLTDIYNTINIAQCIIYINSKNKINTIYDYLTKDNFPVGIIHGNLSTIERESIMSKFKQGDIRILLSTDLLSRGIDVQQLSLVINYDLPIQKETYIHRIGRSGRYGRKGVAINFVTDRDLDYLNDLIKFYDTNIEEMPQNIGDIISA